MLFCTYVIFLLRDEWMIERFSEAMGAALVGNNFSPILWSFHFIWKKKSDSTRPEIYKALNLICSWTESVSQNGSMFSSSEPVAVRSKLETPCVCELPEIVLACPTRASRTGEQPQELGRWFCPLNLRLPSGTAFGEIARWPAGARTWTQTWTVPPDQRVVKVL